mmetsp:Transcript_36166/g.115020  ORF Transcript_36166/g.115020 Transcript_36166/m.115020 type:complete len:317 (-) Transcript_36166:179-1129(-)
MGATDLRAGHDARALRLLCNRLCREPGGDEATVLRDEEVDHRPRRPAVPRTPAAGPGSAGKWLFLFQVLFRRGGTVRGYRHGCRDSREARGGGSHCCADWRPAFGQSIVVAGHGPLVLRLCGNGAGAVPRAGLARGRPRSAGLADLGTHQHCLAQRISETARARLRRGQPLRGQRVPGLPHLRARGPCADRTLQNPGPHRRRHRHMRRQELLAISSRDRGWLRPICGGGLQDWGRNAVAAERHSGQDGCAQPGRSHDVSERNIAGIAGGRQLGTVPLGTGPTGLGSALGERVCGRSLGHGLCRCGFHHPLLGAGDH